MTTIFEYINRPFGSEDRVSDLDLLIQRSHKYTLTPAFDFDTKHPSHPGKLHFRGNFEEFSGAFSVVTDDQDVIDRLITVFTANPGYRKALNKA